MANKTKQMKTAMTGAESTASKTARALGNSSVSLNKAAESSKNIAL